MLRAFNQVDMSVKTDLNLLCDLKLISFVRRAAKRSLWRRRKLEPDLPPLEAKLSAPGRAA